MSNQLQQYNNSDSMLKEKEKQNLALIENLQAEVEKHKRIENELKGLVENGNKNYEELKEEGLKKENELKQLQNQLVDKEKTIQELNEKENSIEEERNQYLNTMKQYEENYSEVKTIIIIH